jgi:hypothetical protein
LGVAFFGVAFFAVAAFFAAGFLVVDAFLVVLGSSGALVLVMRPDLVLPNTRETSASTAGAGAAVFLGLPALALGLAAAALVAVVVAFFAAAGFLAVVALAFYGTLVDVYKRRRGEILTVVVVVVVAVVAFLALVAAGFFSTAFFSTLGSAFLGAAAGLLSFLASFTGPDAPIERDVVSKLRLKLRLGGHPTRHETRWTRQQTGDDGKTHPLGA